MDTMEAQLAYARALLDTGTLDRFNKETVSVARILYGRQDYLRVLFRDHANE